jgi:hypothetical protein
MPRISLNLKDANVEMLEFTAAEINSWQENQDPGHPIQTQIETTLDEAQADVTNGSSDIQYVVIKITI